jgi:hypothetical protein
VAAVAVVLVKQVQLPLETLVVKVETEFSLPLREQICFMALAVVVALITAQLGVELEEPQLAVVLGRPLAEAEQAHLRVETVKMDLAAAAVEARPRHQEVVMAVQES